MKNKQFLSVVTAGVLFAVIMTFSSCAVRAEAQTPPQPQTPSAPGAKAAVYMTADISPAGLVACGKKFGLRN